MNRLERRLREQLSVGEKCFIPFVMAGDPDLATSEAIILALAEAGASAIEVGVPFSDPIADGPVIQRAAMRSLTAGTTLAKVLEMCRRVSAQVDVPLVLFSYLNPLLAFGVESLAREAATSGIAGVLVTDLPAEAARPVRVSLSAKGLDLISLVAPTSTSARLQRIASEARGFIYVVSRRGITGNAAADMTVSRQLITELRRITDLPLALGFGISSPNDAEAAWEFTDAAVVGSAIVSLIEQSPAGETADRVRAFAARFTPVGAQPTVAGGRRS